MEESIEYFASTRKVEKCELTLEHLENLEVVADNGGWEEDKLATLFKVKIVIHVQQAEKAFRILGYLTLGCSKKNKSPNFVSQLTPVVFIG